MKLSFSQSPPTSHLPTGFYYIGQDNYYIAHLNKPNKENPEKYLYSDVEPNLVLQCATVPFTPQQIEMLVKKAKSEKWEAISKMTANEVLNKYSATPMHETPWFYTLLRESAAYVKNYNS